MELIILPLALLLLAALLFFEVKDRRKARLIAKTLLSALFVAAAALQPVSHPPFFVLIITGLILCLTGDVLLALRGERVFFWGLVAFLLGHVAYASAFFVLGRLNEVTGWGAALTVMVSGVVFKKLEPHLGEMLIPVVVYVVMITVMVIGAWTVLGTWEIAPVGRGMILAGALLFYLSDLFVARQRFVKREHLNPLIGLPLYYAGQFLLAFAVGQVPTSP